MPPRKQQQAEEPDLDELLDSLSDEDLEELLERRKSAAEGSGSSKSDRVTILEGEHAKSWLRSFGIETGSNKEDTDGEPPKKRRSYFER